MGLVNFETESFGASGFEHWGLTGLLTDVGEEGPEEGASLLQPEQCHFSLMCKLGICTIFH